MKVRLQQRYDGSEEDDEEEDALMHCPGCDAPLPRRAAFCPNCGEKCRDRRSTCPRWLLPCCGTCCGVTTLVLILGGILLFYQLNSFLELAIEQVGSFALGVAVHLEEMDLNLFAGRCAIRELVVDNPTTETSGPFGTRFEGRFLEVGRFIFDVGPMTLLYGWLTDFESPISLEELALRDIDLAIDIKAFSLQSNANAIVNHMNQVVQEVAPELATPPPTPTAQQTMKAMMVKVMVDRIVFDNITATVTLEPLGPISFGLAKIQITDLGKNSDGVHLYEVVDALVRALLMSVIKAAPDTLRSNMAKAFGQNLWRQFDLGSLDFDAGAGMQKVGEFTGWVATEATLLPLKMATAGANVAEEVLESGTKLNTGFLKAGAELAGFGLRAQEAATKAELNAGIKAAQAGIKVTEALTKVGESFANGFEKALG